MTYESIQDWINQYFFWLLPILIFIAYFLYRGVKYILARTAYKIALRTENVYDDLFVDRLQPFRFAWLVPLLIIYYLASYFSLQYQIFNSIVLVLIIWFIVDFANAVLSGINDVYKHNPRYTGVSAAGYIGILKVVSFVAGVVLTLSLLYDVEPATLLSGVGAWLAVLLLIFRDTILSFLASIQISTQQLIKEGDMVDIPAFGASGTVTEIDLQMITIQNFDNTVTAIPTAKIVDVGFKNYRVMLESGMRRLKRTIRININSVKFSGGAFLESLEEVDFIKERLGKEIQNADKHTTNLQLYMKYVQNYLQSMKVVRQKRYPLVVRVLDPSSQGLPLEIHVFVKAADWNTFEDIQAEIALHLLVVLSYFDLEIW
jgi:miniconductance mechanosensitive channel